METESFTKELVLYVDDVKANLMLFEATFGDTFTVALAVSADEALKFLEKNDVAVVVSDQNMPGMTGTELLEIVAEKYPEIMRFMITAYTDYTTVVDSINKGQVYGYFNKPYNADEVRSTIHKSIEFRRLRIKNLEMIQKLEKMNEQLIEIDRSKISFLTGLTNEIRIPINKISTAVHMIKDRIDSKELTESLHLLDQSMARLDSFSQSTNLLVRLQDSTNVIKQEVISAKELLEVVIIEKRDSFREADLSFKIEDSADLKKGRGEFELLLSCLMILTDLFIQHAAAQSEIIFSIDGVADKFSISISNKKSSYTENERKILAALFNNEDASFSRDCKMELILAQHIVLAHGGKIELQFEEDDSTRVKIILPLPVS